MTTHQPEAIRLAAALDELLGYRGINADVGKAAEELRRLSEANQVMLELLSTIAEFATGEGDVCEIIAKRARAAIAKATKE